MVVKHAVAGVTAAKNAGMQCITASTTNFKFSLSGADSVVDSLEELTLDAIVETYY